MTNRREGNGPFGSHEDRFVCFYDAPSLQELASHETVRAIWHSSLPTYSIKEEETNAIDCNDLLEYSDDYKCQQYTKQTIPYLKVHSYVEENLKKSLIKFCKEIRRWVQHLQQIVFRHECLRKNHEARRIRIDPKCCVWSVNGTVDSINYEKSAREILRSGSLTYLQKYLIMCEFCVEDEIKNFSLDTLPSEFIEQVNFYSHRSCFYWKNELRKTPIENPALTDLNGEPLHEDFNYRFSNDFFWRRLSADDQVRVANVWIRRGYCIHYNFFERIVSTMSWYHQQLLLSELSPMSSEIISRFATVDRASRFVLWMWKHLKGEMPVEQFPKLFCDLICRPGASTSTLVQIWKMASDRQRIYFISKMTADFIHGYLRGQIIMYITMMEAMFNARRNLLFRKTIQGVTPWYDPDLLNEVLSGSLPCSEDQLTLMKLGIDSFRFVLYLEKLFYHRNLKMFDDELKAYFLQDVNAARVYKQLFLMAVPGHFIDGFHLITDINLWDEFCEFIEEAFENDLSGALAMKRRFVHKVAFFSLESISFDPQCYFDLRRGFDSLVKIMESVFDNHGLKREKLEFFQSFHDLKSRCSYVNLDVEFNSKLRQWCFGADDVSMRDIDLDVDVVGWDDLDVEEKLIYRGIFAPRAN